MKVAWHAVPGKPIDVIPSRRDGLSLGSRSFSTQIEATQTDHTVPSGTESWLHAFQALRARLPSFSPYDGTGVQEALLGFCREAAIDHSPGLQPWGYKQK